MAILGIKNRTENWKTTLSFAPLFWDPESRLALARKLGEPKETNPAEVHIELYWKGMRDYLHQQGEPNRQYFPRLEELYRCLFPALRDEIREFESKGLQFRLPNAWNYDPSVGNSTTKLGANLVGTEIDAVLESPEHLFIGEAKAEMDLDGDGNMVLAHQLIRQYVMAKILVRLTGARKKVIPFLVREELNGREQVQVDFMVAKGWLKRENVLRWDQL